MKVKIVTKTVDGTPEEEETIVVIETNSTTRAGDFIRKLLWKFNLDDNYSCPVERVVAIEKDGVLEKFPSDEWDSKAVEWLKKNDWY